MLRKKHVSHKKHAKRGKKRRKRLGLLARFLLWLRGETIIKPRHRVKKRIKRKRRLKKRRLKRVKRKKSKLALKRARKKALKKRLRTLKKKRKALEKKEKELKKRAKRRRKKRKAKIGWIGKVKPSREIKKEKAAKPYVEAQPKTIARPTPRAAPRPAEEEIERETPAPRESKFVIPKIEIGKAEVIDREKRRIIRIKEHLEERVKESKDIKKEPRYEQDWKKIRKDIIKSSGLSEAERERLLREIEKLRPDIAREEKPKVLEIEKPKEERRVLLPEAGKGITIQTEFDQIIELLKEKRKIKLKDLARQFRRDMSIIEEWASTLHDEGLAELVYPFTGGPFIRLKEVKKIGKKTKESGGEE